MDMEGWTGICLTIIFFLNFLTNLFLDRDHVSLSL